MASALIAAPTTQYLKHEAVACGPWECVKGDPKDIVPIPYHELKNSTHAVLQVQGSVSPTPNRFSVSIFNGFDGTNVPVVVRSTDTIGKLQQNVLKLRPDLITSLNLIYNGKPVQPNQTLSELQVKPGATFITFQKCNGG